ncbi:MAG: imidazole glycerol phosphate synthase subunit HisH [Bacteroidetes bacterium]|nr:imidazole glycerol phosphate synthase subunit HisH [Bacteroidota bacterium]
MITIVNYGLGNLGSIENMLKKIGVSYVRISNNPEDILNAKKLILPGVGAFDAGMKKINDSGLIPILNQAVIENKTPILGICLGMQLMTQKSEEGTLGGLNWIDAECIKFKFEDNKIKVPHMGWNYIDILDSELKSNLPNPSKFYFVHSYYIQCNEKQDELLICNYGHPFVAGFKKGNIMGVQFHPEKSHKYGMALLNYFVENIN